VPREAYDAVVVGSGPNGLAAAITLARAGRSVLVLEAASTVGGGVRSAELTLPGFLHDVCSAVFPLGRGSPFFAGVDLAQHGLHWIEPPIALGHPLADGSVALLRRSVEETAAGLGPDARAYERLFGPLVARWPDLVGDLLGPFHVPLWPPCAIRMALFGWPAIQSTTAVARRFHTDQARALFAGVSAHSMLRLTEPISAAASLVLMASAHAFGWPVVAGGSGELSKAMAAEFERLGGEVQTDVRVESLDTMPSHRAALLDVTPRQALAMAGSRFHGRYASRLAGYRYGPGVFKLDIALDGPVPWRNQELSDAGTVHLGGRLEDIAASEAAVRAGRVTDRPFVLLVQPSLFDPSRAPRAGETVWVYCHVPNGSRFDMTEPILSQIERAAPGFRDRILSIHRTTPADLEAYNANDVGGDIGGGLPDLRQLFTRPTLRLDPYSTPDPAIFLCSSSTPPGGGVHGMSGYHAARSALRRLGGRRDG
jgi:phytoene dehydrogenase-like protein